MKTLQKRSKKFYVVATFSAVMLTTGLVASVYALQPKVNDTASVKTVARVDTSSSETEDVTQIDTTEVATPTEADTSTGTQVEADSTTPTSPEVTETENSHELAMDNYCNQLRWPLNSVRNVPESDRTVALKQAGVLFLYEHYYDECVSLGKIDPL